VCSSDLAIRTVGTSRIDPAVVSNAARSIASLPVKDKNKLAQLMGNRKVMLGGTLVTGGAIVGFSADELADLIANSNPDELRNFLDLVDSVNNDAGDKVVEAYNAALRQSQLDEDFSDARSDDAYLSQAPVTGLGLDRDQIEAQQVMLRQYDIVRNTLTYDQLLSLQFLLAHAKPEDLATLEDMRRNVRR
jgi:hypothetical protein